MKLQKVLDEIVKEIVKETQQRLLLMHYETHRAYDNISVMCASYAVHLRPYNSNCRIHEAHYIGILSCRPMYVSGVV